MYVVAGGDLVAVFDNPDSAGVQHGVMEAAGLDTSVYTLSATQWETVLPLVRIANPRPRHQRHAARPPRRAVMTRPPMPPADGANLPPSLAARPHDARRGLPIPPVNVHPNPSGNRSHVDLTTINTTTAARLAAERGWANHARRDWAPYLAERVGRTGQS